ncbi:baseplate J/gp47 family protein [Novacetimonas hansenii]|uniref:baseplate J/gp47 family protein n=1 Tax=Novacetimonas hansenii TaxID=436 RepID=UPI001CE1911F|nr:baseplate J/gp47 family protein [Novacetimonas hansenii]
MSPDPVAPFTQKALEVSFGVASGGFGAGGTDTVTLSGLRCHAQVTNAGLPGGSTLSLRVGGMALSMMNRLSVLSAMPAADAPQQQMQACGNTVTLRATHDGGMDPAFASGRMQDAIARIYFIARNPATATVVSCMCVGAMGTVIPSGTLVQDGAGYHYAATSAGVIPATGTLAMEFACTTTGPVSCPAGAISLYQSVAGLTSVTNMVAGVSGAEQESRTAFEARRAATVAGNSIGSNAAILGGLLSVPGVTDAYVTDNPTSAAITTGGVTIAAHSVYACVVGGDSAAIALAIMQKKPPGCGYTGTTMVTVADPNAAYTTAPSYGVSFDYATPTPVFVAVSMGNASCVPSDALTQVQAAVAAAFDGTDGGTRARIASRLYGP